MQLDIFSIIPNSSSGELPSAFKFPLEPKVEEALNLLEELKEISLSQFKIGSRIIAGDLHGAITSIDGDLCKVLFDGENKARPVFLDSLELERKPLTEGCIVRSRTAFKGKTAKLLRFEQVLSVRFAVVEVDMYGSTIEYSCNIKNLEIVE
jgi:hypothetical protein